MIVFFLTITYPQQQPTESFHQCGRQPRNFIEQKEVFTLKKTSNLPSPSPAPLAPPPGLVWDTNMAVILLFCDTNMAAMISCENT